MSPYQDNLLIQMKDFIVQHKLASLAIVCSSASYYAVMSALQKSGVIHAICPFKNLTGFPCPGCGMTRACLRLFHLDFAGALYYHPMSYLLVSGVAFVLANESVELIYRKKISYRWLIRHNKIILVCLVLLTLANWIWSITKGI